MNHANPSLAKTEIIKQLGYFPAFLIPAINSSLIYQSLVQQTLFAYVNNPLPVRFKEKLFVVLSRYSGIDYFTVCHSCTLRSLGVPATDILALDRLAVTQLESDIAADLKLLQQQWCKDWDRRSDLELILLRCSRLIFLHPEQTANITVVLKQLLGTVQYHYLIVLLGYIKLCHQWVSSNPDIEHQQDRRSQLHLGSLLLENTELAQFFRGKAQFCNESAVDRAARMFENDLTLAIASQTATVSLPQLKQETLTTCLANAPFPVMVHNQQGEIVHLNRNWLEASGYNFQEISTLAEWNQKAQIVQKEIVKLPAKNSSQLYRKYVAPAHKTALEATTTLQQIVNSLMEIVPEIANTKDRAAKGLADAVRSEVTVATKNGDRLHWELYSTALSFDEADELVISIAKDVTDLVHHEAKLAEVEAKLRLVLDATNAGTWSWDLDTNCFNVCRRGRAILGLSDFDNSYQGFLQSIHPQEREAIDLEIAKAIQANRDLDIQYCVVKSERETISIQLKGKLDYSLDGQPIRLMGVAIELSSTQIDSQNNSFLSNDGNSSQDLLDERELFKSPLGTPQVAEPHLAIDNIIDLLPYYLFVIDLTTTTISAINSSLLDSFSLTKERVINRRLDECFPAEYVEQINWLHQQVIDSQEVVHVQEKLALFNSDRYFDTMVAPLFNEKGDIYALLHTSSDIPDLAAAQEALSQRTIQLEAANRELESFSYSVSHDLQAPLRIINGFSQVLWSNYQPNLDDRGKHYLQRIQANSKRMSDLIDALLQLSRVTRSQMKPIDVNLSQIAEEIVNELRGDDPQRQIEVKIAPDLQTKGDPQLLRIVLNNLLHNAWKYSSKKQQAEIEFGVMTDAERATYFVRDNGAGFNPDYADKLFTAFQRLHNQSEFPGTGIGLATVQRIIYRHGGKVWAEGKQDVGATIYFSL